jgi:hypothetical protein
MMRALPDHKKLAVDVNSSNDGDAELFPSIRHCGGPHAISQICPGSLSLVQLDLHAAGGSCSRGFQIRGWEEPPPLPPFVVAVFQRSDISGCNVARVSQHLYVPHRP